MVFSRYIVNWDIRESMTEAEVEIILQGAKEKCPDARPNLAVLPAIEREDRTVAQVSQRGVHPARNAAVTLDARRLVQGYVDHYNHAG
jgi:hypothetical protein